MRISIFRTAHFNAAHRLYIPSWSEEKNKEVFGLCCNPNFHGHNYAFEVCLTGEVDPVTGMLIDLKILKEIIKVEIEDRFDHKNLNVDTEEFKNINPTVENICYVIWDILSKKLGEKYSLSVKLFETPRNYAQYPSIN